MNKQVEQIKAEIERWKRELRLSTSCEAKYRREMLDDLAEFIDSLQEDPDERIRKAIFKALSKKDARNVLLANGIQVSDALDWQEKLGEQKSLAWSEEDEERYVSCLQRLGTGNLKQPETINTVWLKSLKERMLSQQPKQKK